MSNQIEVGDTLAFRVGFGRGRWKLYEVTGITPSGRIKCGNITLNPDLTVRGRDKWSDLPYKAQRITQEITDAVRKDTFIDRIKLVDWVSLDVTKLDAIVDLIEKSATSAGVQRN